MPPLPPAGQRVRVACRLRPPSQKEAREGVACEVASDNSVAIAPSDRVQQARSWSFDSVHGPESTQQALYDDVGAPILEAVLSGYNGTVMAYGQTGAGKTHTLLNNSASPEDAGLVARLIAALFVTVKCDVKNVYRVRASFAQIYNEQVDDLLKPRNTNLKVKHGAAVGVEGLTISECRTAEQLLQLLQQGRRNLIYAETKMNKSSSRSHAVLQLYVSRRQRVLDTSGVGSMHATLMTGKLTIVDLAGSERVKRSGSDEDASGKRMREAININGSLLGLSNVMKALSQAAQHVPYRDSKLTMMLSDAIGGNCRTTLVVCASPAVVDAGETTGTLEFGARAMKVKTNAVVNTSTVILDAAALAADLSEALRLRAEGGVGGQLLQLEAELRERGGAMEALERQAIEDARAREAEVAAARSAAAEEEAAHQVAMAALEERLAAEVAAREAAEARAAEESDERAQLEEAMATRTMELSQQLEDAKTQTTVTVASVAKAEARAAAAVADAARYRADCDRLRNALAEEKAGIQHANASADVRMREQANGHQLAIEVASQRAAAAEAKLAGVVAESAAARRSLSEENAQLRSQLEASELARQALESSVSQHQALLTSLERELRESEAAAALASSHNMARFGELRRLYEDTLSRLRTGEQEAAALRSSCEEFERMLHDAHWQRQHEGERLAAELNRRETDLQAALIDSRAKASLLTAVLGEKENVEAQAQELRQRIAAAEQRIADCDMQLTTLAGELQQTRDRRAELEAECASLQQLTAGELREAEAQRLAEVQSLSRQCQQREAELCSRREELHATKLQASDALAAARSEAQRELKSRHRVQQEMWQRVHRQAVFGASIAKQLHEQRAAADSLRGESLRAGQQLMRRDGEIDSLRTTLRETQLEHVRHVVINGVWVLKHGRKGKPHPRHVRCSSNLLRLEWGRTAVSGNASAGREEKGMSLGEIVSIESGLQTEVAKRSGKGKASQFLSVVGKARTLDLEFSSEHQRDMWVSTLRSWSEAARSGAPNGVSEFGADSRADTFSPRLRKSSFKSRNLPPLPEGVPPIRYECEDADSEDIGEPSASDAYLRT